MEKRATCQCYVAFVKLHDKIIIQSNGGSWLDGRLLGLGRIHGHGIFGSSLADGRAVLDPGSNHVMEIGLEAWRMVGRGSTLASNHGTEIWLG